MQVQVDRRTARRRIRYRIRKKIQGTADRPRLAVHRSLRHISVQVIDDDTGRTLVHASSQESAVRNEVPYGGGVKAAKQVGAVIAKKLKDAGIETVVFDRGGFIYHGRVKALGEAVREGGVKL